MAKVSIIIPCYNQGKYISESINSALQQTYKDIEIICVNDGSADNSAEIMKSFADKYENVVFYNNKTNKGVIYSRNMAIQQSSGEYILPLDSDDIIEPTYVEKAVKILDEHPNIGIVYCRARVIGKKTEEWNLPKFDKSNILYENCIFCSALFRKSDFLKVGMYKEYMQYGLEDFELWLSFIEKGFNVYQIDEILFNYRKYDEQTRTNLSNVEENYKNSWKNVIKNHLDLYLEDEQFLKRLIYSNAIKLKKKYKKYKKLFNIFFTAFIGEFILIVFFLLMFLFK